MISKLLKDNLKLKMFLKTLLMYFLKMKRKMPSQDLLLLEIFWSLIKLKSFQQCRKRPIQKHTNSMT